MEVQYPGNEYDAYLMQAHPSATFAQLLGYSRGATDDSLTSVVLETVVPESVMKPRTVFDDDGIELGLSLWLCPLPRMQPIECPVCKESLHPFRVLTHTDTHLGADLVRACFTFANMYEWLSERFALQLEQEEGVWPFGSEYWRFGDQMLEQLEERLGLTQWLLRQASDDTIRPQFQHASMPKGGWLADLQS